MKRTIRILALTAAMLCTLTALTSCEQAAPSPAPDDDTVTTTSHPVLYDTVVLTEPCFLATVTRLDDSTATVTPLPFEEEYSGSATSITFGIDDLEPLDIRANDVVQIAYDGNIMETYPAQINAVSWTKMTDLRETSFGGSWLPKGTAVREEFDNTEDLIITAVFADCFFARGVTFGLTTYKLNGTLSEDWCIGDQVLCTFENMKYDQTSNRCEMDLVSIEVSDYVPDPYACAKPVIYLYPESTIAVDVALSLQGELTCTYPAYEQGWQVTAAPDGTLTDKAGQTYSYLYWEGDTTADFDMSEGFCVKGEDTAAFLEQALAALGLTRREANEFIVYWLPLMQHNPYNIIAFQSDAYTDAAQLTVTPTPDTVIRVFMTWQASDDRIDLPPQTLSSPAREGFTVVEWGGTQLD